MGKHNTALTPNAAKLAAANPDQGSRAAAVKDEPDIVPVPIKFVFREAVFTEDGGKAAQLLLEYVLLEKLPSLRLTGHADERGTSDFNLKLSADRLTTVANFLRQVAMQANSNSFPRATLNPSLMSIAVFLRASSSTISTGGSSCISRTSAASLIVDRR